MKLYEMEGFLRGKCLPGDLLVNETNAQYLVRKFTELHDRIEVTTAALREKTKQCEQLAAENAALKTSRAVLAENTFEACNAIASAGFSHEAIMRGLYESTGNGNKYPKPITTLVDEAMRKLETRATDAFLREVKSQAHQEGAYFVANRMLAAWDAGFIEDTAKNAADIARMILTSTEFMADAPDGDFDRAFADSVLAEIAAELRQGGAA
ncbi:hypothetical protein QMS67_05020 [Cronobacter turicensis]|uniref:hypothetical protein n=1 Tax=Cronobacter turicensis TaxID=413502 RepID=UPI0024C22B41|nr:hypothetical protein [Cronobacter turicensis]MDK1334186.1 hypothetical protein [Cronobacter turicensis]